VSSSDEEIVDRILSGGDREAFSELVQRHQSRLRSWLRRMTGGDATLADDLAQESFIAAYQNLGKLRGRGKFSAWLYRIAYNRFLSSRRKRSLVTEILPDETASVESPPDVSDLRADLEEGFSRLSEAQKAVITLCYQQGLTQEEVAEVLGWPVGTVKTHAFRAKEILRRFLSALCF
jgi:RNA polymerase sigma factor (sigma-70 family)